MRLVYSGIDDPYFHAGSSVALTSNGTPESGCADQSRRPVHLYVEEIVWNDPSGSRSVQEEVLVLPVQLYRDSVEDDGVFVDDLNLGGIVLQPTLGEASLVGKICRVGLGSSRIQVELMTWHGHRSGIAGDMTIVAGQRLVLEHDYGVVHEDSVRRWRGVGAVVNACC